jgi:hypothetical protein
MDAVGNDERSISITREIDTSPSLTGCGIALSLSRPELVIG